MQPPPQKFVTREFMPDILAIFFFSNLYGHNKNVFQPVDSKKLQFLFRVFNPNNSPCLQAWVHDLCQSGQSQD